MHKMLIANRGEIAVRNTGACRAAGLASVAVFASPDRDAVHVRAADEAVALTGTTPTETYGDMVKVLRAAVDSGADACIRATASWRKMLSSPSRFWMPG